MQLRDFLGKNERDEILFSEVEWLAKELGCSIHAIRKWCSGERVQPRGHFQLEIQRVTRGAVGPQDWAERAAKQFRRERHNGK